VDGIVGDMKKGKATTNVRLRSDIGELTLVMTSSSVEALRLEPGDRATALFREVDMMLLKGEASISTTNRIRGRVLDIKKGNVTAELPLDVGAGRRIVAVIARSAAEEMGLGGGRRGGGLHARGRPAARQARRAQHPQRPPGHDHRPASGHGHH
jgi:molybdate transport system regulatory protein